jgi:hypothetical protein
MNDKAIPSKEEVAALRAQRAVATLFEALVTAIADSEEGELIEVSIEGIADATVDAAIAKFAGSEWTVSRKKDEAKLQVTEAVEVVETPATTAVAAPAAQPAPAPVAAVVADDGGTNSAAVAVTEPTPEPVTPPVAESATKPIPVTRFRVCRVNAAYSPHASTTLGSMFEAVLSGQMMGGGGRRGAPAATPKKTLEAVSEGEASVVSHFPIHGLVSAADLAFRQHYPLMLTPDHIWLTVTQGLAAYIAQDPEKWRKHFVSHEGKETIKIIRNEFVLGSPTNDWAGCFGEFSDAIRGYIGDETHGLIISDFGTTGPVEKAVSQIVLMDSMQSYFEYSVATMCGIPEIILKGEVADWQKLAAKVRQLNERYPDLNSWLRHVIEIVDKLAKAAAGDADTRYFEDIYKQRSESGGEKINGWLLKLFPFCKDWRDDEKLMVNPLLERRDASIRHDRLISPVSKVPFIWEYLGTKLDYEFLGGIVAVEQDPETLALSPRCAWGVRPKA